MTSLIESPQRAAVSSITELAEQMGLSPPYCRGWHDAWAIQVSASCRMSPRADGGQDLLLRSGVPAGSAHRRQELGGPNSTFGALGSANIASMIEQIDPVIFEQTVARLSEAKRARIHGMRQCRSLAFLAYGLAAPGVASHNSRASTADLNPSWAAAMIRGGNPTA